ncbi:MAG: protein kinase, partial [Polyangia bacterium]|nr:protein kinase [Polyangia bacterium]
GTYAYMSPEQWGLGRVDHQSDIWAAGVILFQMITSEHPFGSKATETIMANIGKLDEPVRSVRELVPTVPEEVAQVIGRCLQKRKKNRYKTAKDLLDALESLTAVGSARVALREDQNPYPGLSAFTEQDANRFFGRDTEIAQFIGKLKDRALLGVIGPSGAGKSSFIKAGVLPALRSGGTDWDSIVIRPGRDPFGALTGALVMGMSSEVSNVQSVREAAKEETVLKEELRKEPGKLGALLRARARQHGRPTLLYVDQFEELYTLFDDADERDRFATCLAGAAVDAATPVRVVLTMRSDFLDRVAENQALMNAVTRDLTILQQPGAEGLREAVIRPAALAGYAFEDVSVVDAMVASLAEETAALPLLQFAAQKLWEARDRKTKLLTRAAYTQMGGVEGALVRHADSVIQAMSTGDRLATRRLFQRLVTPEGTRAVLSLGEIVGLFETPREAQRILNVLTEARLLVIQSFGEEAVDARVEIVHESLINRWQTLRRWLDESHEDNAMLAQLREAARQWETRGRPTGLLWTGDAVDEAKRWRRRSNAVLTPLEDAFLTAAFRLADRATRRKRFLLIAAVSAMALVTLGALVALLAIRNAEREAKTQATRAVAEAKRASEAESRVRAQMKLLAAETERAKKAEELASNRLKEVQQTRAREQKAQQDLQRSYQDLQGALARAEQERRRAQAASHQARIFANRAQNSAKAERLSRLEAERAKRMLERLLEKERQEVSRLKALRSKVIQKLPQ